MGPARIIIVEDEMLVACELAAILEDLGHVPVGIAPDMPTAFELADTGPDLALVDLNLRDGLTGPQIGEHLIRKHRCAVLFLTANPRVLGDGVAGTIGVLTKPTDQVAVASAVEYALRVRRGDRGVVPPPALKAFACG
jgi:two-component system, response regulator PdtaR